MVPWWSTIVIAVGFALWSIICVMVGGAVASTAKKSTTVKAIDPRTN